MTLPLVEGHFSRHRMAALGFYAECMPMDLVPTWSAAIIFGADERAAVHTAGNQRMRTAICADDWGTATNLCAC